MLTAQDICKRLDLTLDQVGFLYAKRILPEGIKVGGVIRFREHDIRKFENYLRKRHECRHRGIDPDGPKAPAPPIYSTAGKPRFDPRLVVANEREAKRQSKSRTLAAGSKPIGPQERVALPEAASKSTKVEG
jgi:hypothetical protein